MVKILYIITQSEWGGAQKYVFDLATNLQKSQPLTFLDKKGEGYQIHVAAGGKGELFGLLEAQNLPVTRLKHLGRPIQPLRDVLAYFEIKKLIRTIKPDIVHLNSSKAGFLGALAAKQPGAPKIIYTAHGFVFNEPLSPFKKWLYKKIELWSSKRIDKIITVSEYDRQTAIAAGINPDKLVTIHNGIDFAAMDFRPRHEARKFLFDVVCAKTIQLFNYSTIQLIGIIANFYPTKGLDVLIRAMTKIDAMLVIIGDGPEKKNLLALRSLGRRRSKSLATEREGGRLTTYDLQLQNKIFFVGSMPNASSYLRAFDLFVLASRKEGLPYTLLEAAAAGVPVAATNVGGIPEIIQDGVNGYLAKPDDVNALADAINRGLANPLPPTITGFDLKTMLEKTKAVYQS